MTRSKIIILYFLLVRLISFAQIESSSSVIFNDTSGVNNRVTGIKSVQSNTDGLNVTEYLSGNLTYAVATGINLLNISLPYSPVIVEGMLINIRISNYNTSAVSLTINGSSPYSVLNNLSMNIDSAQFKPGLIVNMIYDGLSFICISKLNQPCKKGFVSVNDEFCIDSLPREINSFYPAVNNCGNLNSMLCTWNQWYIACQDSLNNGSRGYLTNFEWVNDAGNNGSDAKVAGYEDEAPFNGYGCKKSYSLLPTKTFLSHAAVTLSDTVYIKYRCCYKK